MEEFEYNVTLIVILARGDWAYKDFDVSAQDTWQAVEIARARLCEYIEEHFTDGGYMFNVVYEIKKSLKDSQKEKEPDRDPLDTTYDYGYDGDGWN